MHKPRSGNSTKDTVLINVRKDDFPAVNIGFATVTLRRGTDVFRTITDDCGNAILEGEIGCEYILDVEKHGYETLHIENWILGDKEIRLINSLENIVQMDGYDILTMDGGYLSLIHI